MKKKILQFGTVPNFNRIKSKKETKLMPSTNKYMTTHFSGSMDAL